MTEKNTIDYNNGFNDNYISNDGNFDDNDDKKHTNIISFEKICTNFRDFYLVKKVPKNLGMGNPPSLPERRCVFTYDAFPKRKY